MSDKSGIEWTDATWNPVRGCSRVSEGCRNCYAETVAARFSGPGMPYHGFASQRLGKAFGTSWTGKVELVPEKLDQPLRWKRPRRIFVNSMSDLFHEALPDEAIDQVFAVMAFAPQHTYQILTKRPGRMRTYFAAEDRWARIEVAARVLHRNTCAACNRADLAGKPRPHLNRVTLREGPWPNVWLGVSVEDQERADERIPLLLQTPAAVRFVSAEPLLGPVSFSRLRVNRGINDGPLRSVNYTTEVDALGGTRITDMGIEYGGVPPLDWMIVGGESGPGARPMEVAWARSIVSECEAAGVPVFVKQLGAAPHIPHESGDGTRYAPRLTDRKGGDPAEWPEDLRVREFPVVGAA